jgi:hypothetical protein
LILVLVAIVAIVALSALGNDTSGVLGAVTSALDLEVFMLTSLGNSFGEISEGMIELMRQFYEEHGYWPRSWGDYVYTDLGLDPDEWQQAHDGIIYRPAGDRLMIEPADGYTFYVTDVEGNRRELSHRLNWNLVYDMQSGTWHYHSQDGAQLDISTLEVIED